MSIVSVIVKRFYKKICIYWELIKFPHTLFVLPFTLSGAILAANGIPETKKIFWILLAILGARSGGFGLNRLVDKEIDEKNPRTSSRALPKGIVTPKEVIIFVILSFILFIISAYMLSPLCLRLSPLAILVLFVYSYTKRFTWLTHFVLGLSLSIGPIGAWIAIRNSIEIPALILGGAVLFWVAGFDIIYALQDMAFDRSFGIHSIPQRIGDKKALRVSLGLHLVTLLFLFSLYFSMDLSYLFLVGLLVGGILLGYEHTLMRRLDLKKLDFSMINLAFFYVNAIVGLSLFSFILLDRLLIH